MIVGHRIYESRENGIVRVLSNRCRVKAGSGGWVDLEDRVTWMVHRSCGVRRSGVRRLLHGFAVQSFSYVFEYLT